MKEYTATTLERARHVLKKSPLSSGAKMAIGKEPAAQITQRADKSYATQVYYCASFGATRMEEAKVIQILCNE